MIPTAAPTSIAVPMLQHHGSIDGACIPMQASKKCSRKAKRAASPKFDSTPSKNRRKGKKKSSNRQQAKAKSTEQEVMAVGGDDSMMKYCLIR